MKKKEAFDCIAVTAVKVQAFTEGLLVKSNIRGLAEIVLNDQIIIRGIRIMEGECGLFINYPVDPFYKGEEYRSIVFPMARNLREHIEARVLEKYQEVIAG